MKYIIVFLSILCTSIASNSLAQTSSLNGYIIPVKGEYRVLTVFAQIDCSSCPGSNKCNGNNSTWPSSTPPEALDFFDDEINVSNPPSAEISKYYYEMSLGQYKVVGSTYPDIITLSCNDVNNLAKNAQLKVLDKLNELHDPSIPGSTPIELKIGRPISEFDNWTEAGVGKLKTNISDGKIDGVVIIFRNLGRWSGSNQGYGYSNNIYGSHMLLGKNISAGAYFNSSNFSTTFFKNEFFHGMFGGNNFHTGGGAGCYKIPFKSGAVGLTSQPLGTAVSNVAVGWDRYRLGYTPTTEFNTIYNLVNSKTQTISAQNSFGNSEVNSDLSISNSPGSKTFILRDFVYYGDAIRVKLPIVGKGTEHEQWLWLENHQKISEYDQSKWESNPCSGGSYTNKWEPGLMAYIQIGNEDFSRFNECGSFLYPVTAEGSYDRYLRYDFADDPNISGSCIWNNRDIPIERALGLNNSFTGHSDLFSAVDSDGQNNTDPGYLSNGNGVLYNGTNLNLLDGNGNPGSDDYFSRIGTREVVNEQLLVTGHSSGDYNDLFKVGRKINMGTNPAAVPVYTYRSNSGGMLNTAYDPNTGGELCGENRVIWISGLNISVDGEVLQVDGTKALKVTVSWDPVPIEGESRWTGDIVLQQIDEDANLRQNQIILKENAKIILDQGLSPTEHYSKQTVTSQVAIGNPPNNLTAGQHVFADPTLLQIEKETKMKLNTFASIDVINGSTLKMNRNAFLDMGESTVITVDEMSNVCLAVGSNLQIHTTANIFDGSDLYAGADRVQNNSPFPVGFSGAIKTYETLGNVTLSSGGNVTVKAGEIIVFKDKFVATVSSSQVFHAAIGLKDGCSKTPYDYCSDGSKLPVILDEFGNPLGGDSDDGHGHEHSGDDKKGYYEKEEDSRNAGFYVFPNPANDFVHLQFYGGEIAYLSVFDVSGKLVKQIQNPSINEPLNLTLLNSGVYLIELLDIKDNRFQAKIIVE